MWMWLCVERKSCLGLGVGMRKMGRNIVRQKRCQESSIYGYGSKSLRGGGEG